MSAVAERQSTPQTAVPANVGAPVKVIEPWQRGLRNRFKEAVRGRGMIPYYGKSYIRRRYRNTWLGWIWLPLRPAIDNISKAFLFGGLLGAQYGDRPAIIFLTFGNSGWLLFQRTSYWGTRSMRVSRSFVRNAHPAWLPRLVAILIPSAMDFFLSVVVAIAAVLYYWIFRGEMYLVPSKAMLIGIGGIIWLAALGVGLGWCLAPFSQFTRDIRYSFVYVMQFWYYVTPVVYDLDHIPKQYRVIAEYNPLTAPVMLVRHGFLGTGFPPHTSMMVAVIGVFVFLLLGLSMVNRFERSAVSRL
ncbi:MAG: ABC transporter permease [Verrucomicrobiota bacterium]